MRWLLQVCKHRKKIVCSLGFHGKMYQGCRRIEFYIFKNINIVSVREVCVSHGSCWKPSPRQMIWMPMSLLHRRRKLEMPYHWIEVNAGGCSQWILNILILKMTMKGKIEIIELDASKLITFALQKLTLRTWDQPQTRWKSVQTYVW